MILTFLIGAACDATSIGCGGSQPSVQSPTTSTSSPTPSSAPPPPPPPASPPLPTSPAAAAAPPAKTGDSRAYTLADLQALASSQSWIELLQHAEDVRPSERNDTWKSLMVKATTGAIAADRKVDRNREDLSVAVEAWTDRYPSLRESKEFMSARSSVMVEGVEKCSADHRQFEPCMWFATAFPNDAAHAQAAGDAAVKHGHRGLALKLYRVAADLDARTLCQDDTALALVAEARTRTGETGTIADGDAIHASCEKAKKHR